MEPFAQKHELAKQLGATHTYTQADEALDFVKEYTWGIGADSAILTPSLIDAELVRNAVNVIGKGGTVVVVALSNPNKATIQLSSADLSLYEKTITGTIFGSGNPHRDIIKLIEMWKTGAIQLEPLINGRFSLEQINEGYDKLLAGDVIRGLIEHEH